MGILLPILVFFISMNAVYAYFTATASKQESVATTGIISVGMKNKNDGSSLTKYNFTQAKLEPGDTTTFDGIVKNTGNSKIYFIAEYKVSLIKSSTETNLLTCYYTMKNNVLTELTKSGSTYTGDACVLDVNATSPLPVTYTVPTDWEISDCADANLNVSITVCAIQFANIANASTATSEIMKLLLA